MLSGGNFSTPSIKKLINPITDVDTPVSLNILQSNAEFTTYNQVADSVSSSSISYNVVVPNNTLVGRSFLVSMPFTLTINTTDLGGDVYQNNYDALRCMPLNQMIESCQLTVNGATNSSQVSQIIYGAWQLMTDEEKAYYSVSGYQDAYQNLADSPGKSNNSLAVYGTSTTSDVLPRGCYNSTFTINSSHTQAVISGIIYENLWLMSPLSAGKSSDQAKAFAGINTLNLTLNITTDPARFWAHIPGTNGGVYQNSSTLEIGDNTTITLQYYKPSMKINTEIERLYSYQNYVSYTTKGGSVTSGSNVVLSSSTISVDATPSKLLIWCRRSDATRTISTSDTFLVPQTLSVTYGTRANLLTTLNQYSLYQMSKKNGLRVPFDKWSKETGGILVVDVGSDIGCTADEVPGALGRQQFSVQATFKNTSGATLTDVVMYVVPVIPGVFKCGGGSASFAKGLLKADEMAHVQTHHDSLAYLKTEQQNDLFGGGWLSDAWDSIKSLAAEVVPQLATAAAKKYLGVGGSGVVGGMVGGAESKRYVGKGIKDTEVLTPNQLESRLKIKK